MENFNVNQKRLAWSHIHNIWRFNIPIKPNINTHNVTQFSPNCQLSIQCDTHGPGQKPSSSLHAASFYMKFIRNILLNFKQRINGLVAIDIVALYVIHMQTHQRFILGDIRKALTFSLVMNNKINGCCFLNAFSKTDKQSQTKLKEIRHTNSSFMHVKNR